MEKKFKSIEELDAALDEEFAEKEDVDEEEVQEETKSESTDEGESTEESSGDEEVTEDQQIEPEQEEEPKEEPRPKQNKQEFAFGKMRAENNELKQRLEQTERYSSKMTEMATRLGYQNADEMIKAYEEQQLQEEAKQQNVDPEVLRKMNSMETELNTIKKREQEAVRQQGLARFRNTLDTISDSIGLDEEAKMGVLKQMESDGYTVDDIVSLRNHDKLIKGYLAEDLAERKYQERLAAEKESQKLKETKLTGVSENSGDWEDDLMKEMAQYAKENYPHLK